MENNEEISLREIIEILWGGKWIIAVVTAFFMVASGILSFFVLDPEYEAKSTLMVQNIDSKPTPKGNSVEEMLASLAEYPSLTIDTYQVQISSQVIMRKVVKELELDSKYGITWRDLKTIVSVNVPKNTNLMEITVKHSDPQLAASIVNAVARHFSQFVTEQSKKQISKSVVYIEEQLKQEEQNFKEIEQEWKEFLKQPSGVDELQQEIAAKLARLTLFKTELLENQVMIDGLTAAYNQANQQLSKMEKTIAVESSLADHPLLSEAAKSGQSLKDLAALKIEAEEINPAYAALEQNKNDLYIRMQQEQARYSSIQKQVTTLQKDLENLQVQLVEKQLEYDRLNQKLTNARDTYKAFVDKLNEVRLATSVNVGEKNVMVVTEAEAPVMPVGPKKLLNILIAAVLGGMLSVFFVFFKEYWRNSNSGIRFSGGGREIGM